MKINKVTFTGADNNTNIMELVSLQKTYPFVEWGILFSKNKEGEQRYPTLEYLNQFSPTLNLSAHFCGWYAREVLEKMNYSLIKNLTGNFKRVQLNYNFKTSKGWNLNELINFATNNKKIDFILQYNENNKATLDKHLMCSLPENIHFLHDSSGGRGKVIETFNEPFKNYTGYSGGLDDINMESICNTIKDIKNKSNVWIDMESGVRTNEQFDLEKVRTVLRTVVKKY